MKMIKTVGIALLLVSATINGWSFCGFYVAKADATLFNNKSEVILVRNGNYTVITMGSDFQGDVKDFAMVVPVPVVLKRSDINVVDRSLFDRLDAYSAPRLAEYYDDNLCGRRWEEEVQEDANYPSSMGVTSKMAEASENKHYHVTIEAQYTVGEYDIILLSATESDGLKQWLTDNGYKIPNKAEKVLSPYIKSNMKFFVVKVNLEEMKKTGYNELRPIQIRFEHPKFMLPLRLGMANSRGSQDMIVYAFTPEGRVECANYRTMKVPSDRNIPLLVQQDFGNFYKRVFERAWQREGKNCVFLEYAWNVSPSWGGVKCDPCVGPPPMFQDFSLAGVNWNNQNNVSNVFFTRLHVRYDQEHFPMDLQFQVTPNTESFQARYIITHPAPVYDGFNCDWGQEYLLRLHNKRKLEMDEWENLTGMRSADRWSYISQFDQYLLKLPTEWIQEKKDVENPVKEMNKGSFWPDSVSVFHLDTVDAKDRRFELFFGLLGFLILFIIISRRWEK